MSTRDRIEEAVKELLKQIEDAAYDDDMLPEARKDLNSLEARLSSALNQFNRKPITEGGPTQADVRGEVRHDIG